MTPRRDAKQLGRAALSSFTQSNILEPADEALSAKFRLTKLPFGIISVRGAPKGARGCLLSQDNVIGAFSEADAARLSGLTVGQLRAWDRKGFVQPSYAETDRSLPYSRIYSFRDIVSLRVIGQLRNVHKIPLQHLRKVSETLAHLGGSKWTATTLYVLGKRVVFTDPRNDQRVEIVSGQRVFDIPLRIVISDTRKAIANLNHRSDVATGKVVHGKFTLQNEPVFEGTRIPVLTVKRYLDAGYLPEAILSEFPDLTPMDIEVARSFDKGQSAA